MDHKQAQHGQKSTIPKYEKVTFGIYHDVYLGKDLFLFADVFENFRDVSQEHYESDLTYFYKHLNLKSVSKLV